MAHRKPKIWFDHDYLSSLDDPEAPGELFFLSEPSQQVLSQLAEMVLWTRTRWFNGDETEIDTLAWRIYEELKVPLHLDDLIPLIDDVETLLTDIRDRPCCGSTSDPVPYGDPESDLYPYSGPAPLPPPGPDLSTDPYPVTPQSDLDGSGTVDQAEWEDYVCGASNFLVDALIDWFDFCIFVKQANIVWNDALQALLPIIARYIPGTIDDYAVIAISLAQDAASAFQAVTTQMLEDGKTALVAERDALNCAMRGELTSQSAANAFYAVLTGAAVDAAIISLLQTGPMIFLASMIWNAAFDHDISYTCDCEDPGQSVGYSGFRATCSAMSLSLSGDRGLKIWNQTCNQMLAGEFIIYRSNADVAPYTIAAAPQAALDTIAANKEFSMVNGNIVVDNTLHFADHSLGSGLNYDYTIDFTHVWNGSQWLNVVKVVLESVGGQGCQATVDGNSLRIFGQSTTAITDIAVCVSLLVAS